MWNRASVGNLLLSLVAFLVFMVVLLAVLGSGVGVVELTIWLIALIVGSVLIIRRHRIAKADRRRGLAHPSVFH